MKNKRGFEFHLIDLVLALLILVIIAVLIYDFVAGGAARIEIERRSTELKMCLEKTKLNPTCKDADNNKLCDDCSVCIGGEYIGLKDGKLTIKDSNSNGIPDDCDDPRLPPTASLKENCEGVGGVYNKARKQCFIGEYKRLANT